MNNTNAHWTDDAELLADFVLDRLDAPTKLKLGVHLHECDTCRKAVDAELMILAGAKLLGREDMKNRLRGHVSVPRSRQIPWPHILSAAAILVIITGIGVFNRWFVTHEDVVVHDSQVAQIQSTPLEQGFRADSQTEGKGVSTGETLPKTKAFAPPLRKKELTLSEARPGVASEERQETDRLQDMKLSDRAREVIKDRDLARTNTLPSETEFSVQGNESGARPTASADLAAAAPEQSTWVQGTIIEQHEDSRVNVQEKDAVQLLAKPSQVGMERKDRQQSFKIQQRSFAALPLSQQQLQQTDRIQALVEQSENGEVQLTLFLEQPFSEGQLNAAIVQQISNDSILVVVGGQMIGYRIPPEAYQAAPMK